MNSNSNRSSNTGETWQCVHDLIVGGEDLLLYRQLLCSCLGGLDDMDERCMVRYLIKRSNILLGISS